LADAFDVHLLDLRNHGSSPWDDDHRYEALALDIATHLETYCPDGALLMGHSMGARRRWRRP
jgi:pimeloyl-ACP methyl ester carboxylesterase